MVCTIGMPSKVKADIGKLEILETISEYSEGDLVLREIAIAIAGAESNFEPSAKNPNSTATGIYQFLIGSWRHYECKGTRWDYKDNIKCAVGIMRRIGFKDWNSSKHIKGGWWAQLSPEARQRVSGGIVKPTLPAGERIISFAGGKIKINIFGSILDYEGNLFQGGKIPFVN